MRSLWRRSLLWLGRAPIADPVDRSNAVALQVVLFGLLVTAPVLWFYRLVLTDIPLRPGEPVSMALSALILVVAGIGLWLIRRGRFQLVLRAFLVTVAAALMGSYLAQGAEANRYEAPLQMAWLIMAGLMVGRRALWLLYGWVALAVVLGTRVDVVRRGVDAMNFTADAIVTLMIYLFITLLVDRAAGAFRQALARSEARGARLAASSTRLREEIVRREEVHRQLIHSQKTEIAGRLAAGLAHDFNHLLTLIHGYRARAAAATDAASREQALAGIDSAARRAAAVSQRLLSFSGRGETRSEVFDANAALAGMQGMLRQLLGPMVLLAFEDAPGPLPVHMDRGEFELVVLNLAANSLAAMPAGGHFSIRTSSADGEVRIALSDTGSGMDEETLARAQEPFFSRCTQGTGLGLSVAADVISHAGGALKLESRPSAGTTVHLSLPLAQMADNISQESWP